MSEHFVNILIGNTIQVHGELVKACLNLFPILVEWGWEAQKQKNLVLLTYNKSTIATCNV